MELRDQQLIPIPTAIDNVLGYVDKEITKAMVVKLLTDNLMN